MSIYPGCVFVLAALGKAGEQEVLLDGIPRKLGDSGLGFAASGVGRGGRAGVTTLQAALTIVCAQFTSAE